MKKLRNKNYLLTIVLFLSGCGQFEVFKNSAQKHQTPLPSTYGEKVRLRLIENVPNYQFCLEKYLRPTGEGAFNGSVTFSLLINKHGTVRNVAILSDKLKNLKAKGCLIKVLTMMEMPKHNKEKDFEVRQPMGINMR